MRLRALAGGGVLVLCFGSGVLAQDPQPQPTSTPSVAAAPAEKMTLERRSRCEFEIRAGLEFEDGER